MSTQKKMYKVISPIEKKGGGTYWMRIGTAFTNRDDSINLYLDAMPAPNGTSHRYEIQIREMTEEDLRKRDGSYGSRSNGASNGNGSGNGDGYGRDLGGVGGGPSSRAVTSSASGDVPF